MEINVHKEVMRVLDEILIKGGEFTVKVKKRGNERLPEIHSYPQNYLKCNTEVLAE